MSIFILHLETTTKVCSVALSESGNLIDCIENGADNFIHGEFLTVYIEEILDRNNLKPLNLSAISFSSGPGSYTGLRIGLSTAKGICFALSIPLISVSTFESLAKIGAQKHPDSILVPMIDARRMEVYSQIFDSKLKTLKPLSADILDENTYSEFEPFVCYGDGAEKMQIYWKDRNVKFDSELSISAKGQVQLAYEKFISKQFENLAYYTPLYLKDFIAG